MPKFRKKPIIVEAIQWHIGKEIKGVYFDTDKFGYFVDTPEGPSKVSEGDWIIVGIAGERYPCRDDIFQVTYDPV